MVTFASLLLAILSNGTQVNSVGAFVKLSNGRITDIYGKGELKCGDPGKAVPCSKGAITASGAVFDPTVPSVALSLPKYLRLRPRLIHIKTKHSDCITIWLLDKKHPRYMPNRPWDITPAAAKLLNTTGKAKIFLCTPKV